MTNAFYSMSSAVIVAVLMAGCIGCATGRVSVEDPSVRHQPSVVAPPSIGSDFSFIDAMRQYRENPTTEQKQKLAAHPAIGAIARHHQMTRGSSAANEELLEEMLARERDPKKTQRIVEYWRQRPGELRRLIRAAFSYLPQDTHLDGRVFFVTHHNDCIVAPPDAVVDLSLPFFTDPEAIGVTILHEVHHIGFIHHQKYDGPYLTEEPERLLKLVQYATQMEGMAVHAVYPIIKDRLTPELLSGRFTQDYRVYVDPAHANEICRAYSRIYRQVSQAKTLTDGEVETILTDMTNGKRLWYQFGAWIAWEIEKNQGVTRLAESIRQPRIFQATADKLMVRCQNNVAKGST